MEIQAMAAQYTKITLEEMAAFLKRGFRALKPKMSANRGEIVFDLYLSEKAGIRVWTSIAAGREEGAGLGEDAIRIQFYNFGQNRPLIPGKAPIVKRTQNWRDSLKDRIEDYIELYDDKEGYWESRT